MAEDGSQTFDVAVVGGGVVGLAVFRALVLGGLRVILLEKGTDILSGASKGNSAILHTGFDAPPGSRELSCMKAGREEYLAIAERLNLPVQLCGALLAAWNVAELERLAAIMAQAKENGIADVRPLAREELGARAPGLSEFALGGLWIAGEAIIDPWSAPLAYGLQGLANGGTLRRSAELVSGRLESEIWVLRLSDGGEVRARAVVNCAGLFGDLVETIAREPPFRIAPRKGQFVVFDKTAARHLPVILLPVPSERTKGVVVTPTIFGNLLVGPTAEEVETRTEARVEEGALRSLIDDAVRMVPALAGEPVTATYAGLRPATQFKDYQIEALPERRWITVAGIRSTGLTAALGIGALVRELYADGLGPLPGLTDPVWTPVPNLAEALPRPFQAERRTPIVCHCELVTEGEIEAALGGPLPAGDLGGLKRRTRAMMGRCQGFYCSAHVTALAGPRLGSTIAPEKLA